jgi:hypothetical protein
MINSVMQHSKVVIRLVVVQVEKEVLIRLVMAVFLTRGPLMVRREIRLVELVDFLIRLICLNRFLVAGSELSLHEDLEDVRLTEWN